MPVVFGSYRPVRSPLHRSGHRLVLLGATALVLAGSLGGLAAYLRRNVVPPSCRDPRTLALVRQSLTDHFGLPRATRIENVQTLAGGALAFRFVCEADLALPPLAAWPPGGKPGFVRYTSQLTGAGTRHDVTVEILPLIMWEKVW